MKALDDLRRDWPMATEILKLESWLWRLASTEPMRVVLFTSALRGEGKSTTVGYLAAALAVHPGRRILAVDLDFRRPSLNSSFGIQVRAGVADMLRGECQLDDAVFVTELPGLHLLLPCREGEKSDPALLHDSTMLQAMFEQLRDRYDLVLIDSPALIPVADATALIPLSDGVVLASMAGLTTKHHLARARDLVLGMGGRILGLVVGNVQEAAPEYLDAGYYHGYARPDGKRHFGS